MNIFQCFYNASTDETGRSSFSNGPFRIYRENIEGYPKRFRMYISQERAYEDDVRGPATVDWCISDGASLRKVLQKWGVPIEGWLPN